MNILDIHGFNDIAGHILKYLPQTDLVYLSRACKKFHQAIINYMELAPICVHYISENYLRTCEKESHVICLQRYSSREPTDGLSLKILKIAGVKGNMKMFIKNINQLGGINNIKKSDPKRLVIFHDIFYSICEAGKIEIVKFLMDNMNLDWDGGFMSACDGNQLEVIKLLLERRSLKHISGGLRHACENGSYDVVKFLLEKNMYKKSSGHMFYAGVGGCIKIINELMMNGEKNLDECVCGAIQKNNMDVISYMISKGANNWNLYLTCACGINKPAIALLMIGYGATHCSNCNLAHSPASIL